MKKRGSVIFKIAAAIVLSVIFTAAVSAEEAEVTVASQKLTSRSEVVDSTTCVPFRSFVNAISGGDASVSWDSETNTAMAVVRGVKITATVGEPYITANGRCIMCGIENYVIDGRVMTAVRPLARAFGANVKWYPGTYRVSVGGITEMIESGDTYYDKTELYWLSRIISAEAKGEPLYGKLAVGAVVYNRVESDNYPDTVYDVIFDMKNGVQFTPAKNGAVYDEPTEDSVIAAKLCMEGYRYRDDILYFCTTDIRYTCWAGKNRTYVETIGGHAFFA